MNNLIKTVGRPNTHSGGKTIFSLIILSTLLLAMMTGCNKDRNKSFDVDGFFKRLASDDGNNVVTIQGIVSFTQAVDDFFVNKALEDLYLKYVEVVFSAENKLGKFKGTINSSSCPSVVLYVHGDDIQEDDDYFRFQQFCGQWSYYYKIKCDSVRIVNADNRTYSYTTVSDFLTIHIAKHEGSDELARRNHIDRIMVDLFLFDRLGKNHTHKFIRY